MLEKGSFKHRPKVILEYDRKCRGLSLDKRMSFGHLQSGVEYGIIRTCDTSKKRILLEGERGAS